MNKGIPFDTWETTFPERLAEGVKWRTFEVALSDAEFSSVRNRFGEPHPDVDFLDGIGPMKAWMSRFPCGCELAVWEVDGITGRNVRVLSNDPDLDHVLHHFALPVSWRIEPKDAPFPIERWSLFRQDDNGNRFHIRDFDSMFSAECARREFEGRGHKQLYTIEKA
jgi:hypothetical protein